MINLTTKLIKLANATPYKPILLYSNKFNIIFNTKTAMFILKFKKYSRRIDKYIPKTGVSACKTLAANMMPNNKNVLSYF